MWEIIFKTAASFDVCFGLVVAMGAASLAFYYAGRRWPESNWPQMLRAIWAGFMVMGFGLVLRWLLTLIWQS